MSPKEGHPAAQLPMMPPQYCGEEGGGRGRRRRRWWRTSPISTSEEAEAAARRQVQGLTKFQACRGQTWMAGSVPGREPRPAEAHLDEAQQ
eukprot:6503051-Pyramimonas_sp.AAC.1